MSKILGKAKSLGKNYYLYATLYCVGIVGMLIITYFRYDILNQALNFDNWIDVMYLLGTLLALPVLAYMFLQKITRGLATMSAGIISILIMIMYAISTSGANTFIETLRNALAPFLALFFIYSALSTMPKAWKKISR